MKRLQRKSPPKTERARFVPRLPHPSWRPEFGAPAGPGRLSVDDFWQRLGI